MCPKTPGQTSIPRYRYSAPRIIAIGTAASHSSRIQYPVTIPVPFLTPKSQKQKGRRLLCTSHPIDPSAFQSHVASCQLPVASCQQFAVLCRAPSLFPHSFPAPPPLLQYFTPTFTFTFTFTFIFYIYLRLLSVSFATGVAPSVSTSNLISISKVPLK